MRFKLCISLTLLLVTLISFSQNNKANNPTPPANSSTTKTIKGSVIDSLTNKPIEFASVGLFSETTKSLIQGDASNTRGAFSLKNIKPGSYVLQISFLGYNTTRIRVSATNLLKGDVDLRRIKLKPANLTLSTVTVTAKLPGMVVKEDTVEYNATAYKVPEGAVVEDLLKRLPGVDVDVDGKITTAAGKQVTKIRVNGKAFFGDDPKMATKNLTADMVDKVQVIEKKSDLAILTGVDDDDPETIINITIKKGMMKGWMGNGTGGLGTLVDNKNNEDARYKASAMLNKFTEDDQYSFVANSNNINETAATDRGNSVRSGRGGSQSAGNGITNSSTTGFNMAKIVNPKLKVESNLAYNYGDNYSNTNSYKENIFSDSVSYVRSNAISRNFSNNLSAEGKIEFQADSSTTIILTPSFSYNSSFARNVSSQKTMAGNIDSTLVNQSNSASTLHSNGADFRLELDIARKLSASGREVSISGSFDINNSNGTGTNNSNNTFYLDPSRNSIFNQQSQNKANRSTYNLRATYVEPIAKGYFLDFSYNAQFNNTVNQKETYDFDPLSETYTTLNAAYSKSTKVNAISQNIRANFRSVHPQYTYNIGINIAPSYTKNIGFIKDWYGDGQDSIYNAPPSRSVINLAPQFDFTYRFGKDKTIRKHLRIKYNGRTSQPTVSQLDASEDITNPLNIKSGNPSLLPSFNHNLSMEYTYNNRANQQSFSGTLLYTMTQNAIINYTSYEAATGIQHSKPINENGIWNAQGNIFFSTPLDEQKQFNLFLQSNLGYSNQIGYLLMQNQSEINITKTASFSPNISLSYKNDWLYNQLKTKVRYNTSSYSMSEIAAKKTTNFALTYNTQVTLPHSFTISSDITYTGNRGLSSGYNQNEVMWNAQINKQVFKNNQGSVRFQINDILHQKLNISRSETANSITDTQYTALTSYFMALFSYRFNNMSGHKGRKFSTYSEDGIPSPQPSGRGGHGRRM